MVLSIDATQDLRSQKASIRPIVLVTITVTKPSAKTYRFSHNYRIFGGNEYLDYLTEIAEASESMNHFDSEAPPASFFVELLNGPFAAADMLTEFLSVTYENASILVEELLLDTDESRDKPISTGQITRFKGRIRKLSKIEDQTFVLECTDERMFYEDAIDWRVVEEADPSPPREVNRRLPKPYGAKVLVPCVAWDVGADTTLAEDLTDVVTGVKKFTDVSQFPSGTFDAILGAERIGFTAKSDANNTLTIGTRGKTGGSAAVAHKAGETIVELQTNNYWVAGDGADIKSINDVFMRSPSTGELFKITDQVNTLSVANTTLVSGRTVASILLKDTDIETIKQLDNLTQQPDAGGGIISFPFNESSKIVDGGGGESFTAVNATGLPTLSWLHDTSDLNELQRFVVFAKSTDVEVSRFRVGYVLKINGGTDLAGGNVFRASVFGPSGEEAKTEQFFGSSTEGQEYNGQSGWTTVSSQPKTLNNFVNASKSSTGPRLELRVFISDPTDDWVIQYLSILVEFDTVGGLNKDAASFAGGFGFELFAEVDGYKVPAADTTYSVAAGTLIERDYDIARHILQVQAGVASADLATDFNTEGALEQTSSEHALVLNDLGTKTSDLLASLGNESRANIVPEAGKWRFIRRRQSPPGYGAAGTQFSKENVVVPIDISIRPLEEIWNKTRARYDFDPSEQGGEDEVFKGRVTADNSASITKFGARELDPLTFQTIRANLVAQETLDELLQEQKDRRYTVTLTAPYYDTFKLQLGDIISVLPPFLTVALDVRILEIKRNLETQVARIVGIEVLTS